MITKLISNELIESYKKAGIAFIICAWCDKIHAVTEENTWHTLEEMGIHDEKHIDEFTSHGLCNECSDEMNKLIKGANK